MPRHHWHDAVMAAVGCSHDDYQPHRERANRAYTEGESVEIFAMELRHRMRRAKIEARAEHDGPRTLARIASGRPV
jgi:hypothetical protein